MQILYLNHLFRPTPILLPLRPPSKPTMRQRYAHHLKPLSDSSLGQRQAHSTLPCRAPIFVNQSSLLGQSRLCLHLSVTLSCATRSTLSATNGDLTACPRQPTFSLSSPTSSMCVLGSRMWIIDMYIKPLKRACAEQRFIVRTPPSLFPLFFHATLRVLACASCLFLSPV
ncbi:hypothetical protein BC827DRAFT_438572 [Russula dissimulans]|nr:hypothetical protein BC827DRAFT_438572 [Russula dissimulans]